MSYIKMVQCPEIQGQRETKDDSRYYVKEDIWGFDKEDAEYRREEAQSLTKRRAKRHPEKPPYKADPILKAGETVVLASALGDYGDIDGSAYHVLDNYPDKFVWLPRQEDIQEMLPKRSTWFENLFRLYDWMTKARENPFDSPIQKTDSIIELWIVFYMYKTHSKKWDGEQWIEA